jgi:hypothetical protein
LAQERLCDDASNFCFTVTLPSGDQNYTKFKLEAPSNIGWVALGVGDSMVGSYHMIAWANPDNNNSITISQRTATGYSEPKVTKQQSDLTLDPSSGITNGSLVVIIQRQLAVQGSTISTSSQPFVWAVSNTPPGSSAQDARLSIHTHKNTVKLSAAQMTASSSQSTGTLDDSDSDSLTKTQKLIFAHAAFMCLAWLAFSPSAVFIVRFARKLIPQWWFSLHWWLQVFGTTFFVGLGFLCIHIQPIEFPDSSIKNAHSVFGYTVFIGTFVQVLIGHFHHKFFKADRGYIPWWTKLHWWVGRSLQILALIQIPIGFNLYGFDPNIYFAYLLYLTIVVVLFVILSIRLYVQKKKEAARTYNKVAN